MASAGSHVGVFGAWCACAVRRALFVDDEHVDRVGRPTNEPAHRRATATGGRTGRSDPIEAEDVGASALVARPRRLAPTLDNAQLLSVASVSRSTTRPFLRQWLFWPLVALLCFRHSGHEQRRWPVPTSPKKRCVRFEKEEQEKRRSPRRLFSPEASEEEEEDKTGGGRSFFIFLKKKRGRKCGERSEKCNKKKRKKEEKRSPNEGRGLVFPFSFLGFSHFRLVFFYSKYFVFSFFTL